MNLETWVRQSTGLSVEAIRLNEENVEEVAAWCGGRLVKEIDPEHPNETQYGINVMGPKNTSRASLGMYVIKFGRHFFVAHNRNFEEQYIPADRPAPPMESAGDSRKARGFADPFDLGRNH